MCDEGEKTCPLCAEQMDLTDQQLKPCKCGYEICVWCWHHIMDMAEKDETEGRCPACRAPYDKEKIVGMAAKCERLVAEVNTEKKTKSQKTKTKFSEGRKQLGSVRVIQRNLVYIMGLPLNLADEDILQQREYFGQYGKVLKVSMSRTATGAIQQFPNSTCSVYITFSKEQEAIHCIQSVHGHVLDGRTLRACFGTTKYCHAWLRNAPCTNPECLYLHETGSQEDSFTKDEIISAYTRTRVQQMTGNDCRLQRHTGSALPPPIDDSCNSSLPSATKPNITNTSNSLANMVKVSLPNGTSARSATLPAAASWGQHAQAAIPQCSYRPYKEKFEMASGVPTAVIGADAAPHSIKHRVENPPLYDQNHIAANILLGSSSCSKQHNCIESLFSSSDKRDVADGTPATNITGGRLSDSISSKEGRNAISMAQNNVKSAGSTWESANTFAEKEEHAQINSKSQKLCSDVSSLGVHGELHGEASGASVPTICVSDPGRIGPTGDQGLLQQSCVENYKESLLLAVVSNVPSNRDRVVFVPTDKLQTMRSLVEEDVLCFNNQRLEDPEVLDYSTPFSSSGNMSHVSNCSSPRPLQHSEVFGISNISAAGLIPSDNNVKVRSSAISSRYLEKMVNNCADLDGTSGVRGRQFEMLQGDGFNDEMHDQLKAIEGHTISNCLSLDFDLWSDSLASPDHLANLLGESDKHEGSVGSSIYRKVQNSNQSRFSFARQEELSAYAFNDDLPFTITEQMPRHRFLGEEFGPNCHSYLSNRAVDNGSLSRFEEVRYCAATQSFLSSGKTPGSRSQISAPPGFSVPNKAPPPGFPSHERIDRNVDTFLGNHSPDINLLRNSYQTQPHASVSSTGDVEFMDPAILAVGRGTIQGGFSGPAFDLGSLAQQLNTFDSDSGHNLLMKRSFPAHSKSRYETSTGYASVNDSFDIASRIFCQTQMANVSSYTQLSPQRSMSNGRWSDWNTFPGGDGVVMAELLKNERLGINKICDSLENQKYYMPCSGHLYNRSFGM